MSSYFIISYYFLLFGSPLHPRAQPAQPARRRRQPSTTGRLSCTRLQLLNFISPSASTALLPLFAIFFFQLAAGRQSFFLFFFPGASSRQLSRRQTRQLQVVSRRQVFPTAQAQLWAPTGQLPTGSSVRLGAHSTSYQAIWSSGQSPGFGTIRQATTTGWSSQQQDNQLFGSSSTNFIYLYWLASGCQAVNNKSTSQLDSFSQAPLPALLLPIANFAQLCCYHNSAIIFPGAGTLIAITPLLFQPALLCQAQLLPTTSNSTTNRPANSSILFLFANQLHLSLLLLFHPPPACPPSRLTTGSSTIVRHHLQQQSGSTSLDTDTTNPTAGRF